VTEAGMSKLEGDPGLHNKPLGWGVFLRPCLRRRRRTH